MAYVAMDADAVQSLIDSLAEYRDNCEGYRSYVANINSRQGWPVPLLYVPETIVNNLAKLDELKQELKGRLEAAKAANDSGQTFSTPEGWVQYYIPDGKEDTLANAKEFNHVDEVNQAKADAVNLRDNPAGFHIDDVCKNAEAYKGSPIYANVFCQTYGAGRMLDSVAEWESSESMLAKMIPLFAEMWSTCSTSPTHGYSLADDINKSIRWHLEKRVPALDAIMSHEEAVYGTDFLLSLAEKVEDIKGYPADPSKEDTEEGLKHGKRMLAHTRNPLAAVLHGMGTNPEAANQYLAPPDPESLTMDGSQDRDDVWEPSQKAKKRMEMLRNRSWGRLGMEGFTAAVAAASSQRLTPLPGDDRDERAAWATGNGVSIIAGMDEQGSEKAWRNIGTLVGNCGQELVWLAEERGFGSPYSGVSYLTDLKVEGGGPGDIKRSLAELFYNSCSSAAAAPQVVKGVIAHTATVAANKVGARVGGSNARLSAITDEYAHASNVLALMQMIDNDVAEQAFNHGQAATQGLSLVPGVGPASTLVNLGMTFMGPAENHTYTEGASRPQNALRAAFMTNVIAAGLVPPPTLSPFYPPGRSVVTVYDQNSLMSFNSWADSEDRPRGVRDAMKGIGISNGDLGFGNAKAFKAANGGDSW